MDKIQIISSSYLIAANPNIIFPYSAMKILREVSFLPATIECKLERKPIGAVMDDDASIVESVLSGNADDFRKLVEKYQYMVERWAFQRIGNLSDAESIAQEAFVQAYIKLHTLNKPGRFASWLHGIVTNIAMYWLRRRRSTVSLDWVISMHNGNEELFERHFRCDVPKPDDLVEQQEQSAMLQTAIDNLPPAYRCVIRMFYFDSRSYAEIAECMEISVDAVRNALHRARRRLRKDMMKNEWR